MVSYKQKTSCCNIASKEFKCLIFFCNKKRFSQNLEKCVKKVKNFCGFQWFDNRKKFIKIFYKKLTVFHFYSIKKSFRLKTIKSRNYCHQVQNVIFLAILERVEFKHFPAFYGLHVEIHFASPVFILNIILSNIVMIIIYYEFSPGGKREMTGYSYAANNYFEGLHDGLQECFLSTISIFCYR